jgi:hypothetical protein
MNRLFRVHYPRPWPLRRLLWRLGLWRPEGGFRLLVLAPDELHREVLAALGEFRGAFPSAVVPHAEWEPDDQTWECREGCFPATPADLTLLERTLTRDGPSRVVCPTYDLPVGADDWLDDYATNLRAAEVDSCRVRPAQTRFYRPDCRGYLSVTNPLSSAGTAVADAAVCLRDPSRCPEAP